jgi:hypothetical protein
MRKKCVRWTKSVRTALGTAATIITALTGSTLAQSNDPSAQPKIQLSDISYLGGFRLPATAANGDSFSFGGRQLAFNPAGNSLIVGSRAGRLAEVTIPNPVNSSNAAALPFASYLQPFSDPTEGHLSQITGEGVALDSIMVFGNRLYGTASVYYDANNTQQVSHYSRSLQLNEPSFQGWSRVWDANKTGFVSGWMTVVPNEWRAQLGGPAATGQCCLPVVMRTSWGPSAFAFDPAKIGQTTVAATPLLYYTGEHPTLGSWDGANPTYGATIQMGGMAMIAGTRTVLYIGRNGMGTNCYGNGTSDRTLDGTVGPDGAHWCYDPTSSDKSQHAYPYRYQIWAYDMNDFAAVKAGTKQPWEVVPYGVWPFDFPTAEESVRIGGVGYDPVTQRLYVSQLLADRDGYSYRPVIHVLQINATPGSPNPADAQPLPTPTSPTPTAPGTTTPATPTMPVSSVVSAISLSVNRTAPQVTGTAITFAAFATGGISPQEYKWMIDDGSGMKAVTGWSVLDTFTWTPGTANARYRVGVWARSHGNSTDAPEASASTPFAIIEPPPVAVSSVTISANRIAPQAPGTSVTLQATAAGGSGPVQYKWLIYDGNPTWVPATGWTTSSTFVWTPTMANANYAIRVWARSAGATNDAPQAQAEMTFAINTPAAVRLSAVTMTANKSAPQAVGATINFQAAAVGGAAQYKFLLYDGSPTWKFLTGWTSQSSFAWTPTLANPNYSMRVLVRSATNTTDEWEADTRIDFPIAIAHVIKDIKMDTISRVPVAAPAKAIASVSLATDKESPQVAGTTVVTTATVSGGSSTLQYRWLIHDGGSWKVMTGWTSSKTFSWTPSTANPGHFIGVWVRNAANATGEAEVTASLPFTIQ